MATRRTKKQAPVEAVYASPITSITDTVDWTVDKVKSALEDHEQGYFHQSADLAVAFNRDPRISGCLRARVKSFTGLPFSIKPAAQNPRRSKVLAEEASNWFLKACPETTATTLLKDRIVLGVACAQIIWERDGGSWVPAEIRRWSPKSLWWRQDLMRFDALTDKGIIPVTPGDGNWILWTSDLPGGWLDGAVLSLGIPFLVRSFGIRDWSRFNERHGLPILTVKEPAEFDPKKAKEFFEKIRNISRGGAARLPSTSKGSFELGLVEAKDSAWETFKELQAAANVDIAISINGQNLTTEVQSGSLAAAKVQNETKRDLTEADATEFGSVMRDQAVCPWIRFNRSEADVQLAPTPTYDPTPPEDTKLAADTFKTVGEAVKLLREAGVDPSPVLAKFGLTMAQIQPAS